MIQQSSPIEARVRVALAQVKPLLDHMPKEKREAILRECLPEPIPNPAKPFTRYTASGVRVRFYPVRRGEKLYWHYRYSIGNKRLTSYVCPVDSMAIEVEREMDRVCNHAEKLNLTAVAETAEPQQQTLFKE